MTTSRTAKNIRLRFGTAISPVLSATRKLTHYLTFSFGNNKKFTEL